MNSAGELRIATWNINGIRSFTPEEFKRLLDSIDADIICVQETKVTRDMLDERTAIVDGYYSFFSCSKTKSGYAGVATFCKLNALPIKAEEGLTGLLVPSECKDSIGDYANLDLSSNEIKSIDAEGRAIITQHSIKDDKTLVIINVYCPRADPDLPDRLIYKLKFYEQMYSRAEILSKNNYVLIVGDLNCSHKHVDSCDPGNLEEFYSKPSRQWFNQIIKNNEDQSSNESKFLFVDCYRQKYPDTKEAYTCWNTKMGARQNNYGTRIDYILSDIKLSEKLLECEILKEIMGSDHCPVKASFNINQLNIPLQPPSLCSKYFPEFAGKQQKLSAFLQPKQNTQVQTPTTVIINKEKKLITKQSNLKDFFGPPKSKIIKLSEEITNKAEITTQEITGECSSTVDKSWAQEVAMVKTANVNAWKNILGRPPDVPLCRHNEKCVIKTSKKKGPNFNRQFYSCNRTAGSQSDPQANCNFFRWVKK